MPTEFLRAKFREKSCVSVLSGIKNFGNSRCAYRAKKNATCDFLSAGGVVMMSSVAAGRNPHVYCFTNLKRLK